MKILVRHTGERYVLAYKFNAAGYFIGFEEADESPLEPGVFLIPANSTEVEPPEPEPGKLIRWNGSEWFQELIPEAPVVNPEPATEEQVRAERNQRLLASDYTQLADVPISNRVEWATYRQALRDVPEQAGFPANVEWPTPPEYLKT